MKIAICDDLADERIMIMEHLNQYFSEPTLMEFGSGNDLVNAHEIKHFDLILLDMLMPGLNGIETAEKIRVFDKQTPIVFVTTTEDFAVQSYRVLAFDYLLKPVTPEAMKQCLSRFDKIVPDMRTLSIDYMGVTTDILYGNIIYLESAMRKVTFNLSGKKHVTITAKLEEFMKLTDEPYFCRCHKSFLVNLNYVSSISGEEFYLTDGTKLKISRAFLSGAKKAYFDYVFGKGGMQENIYNINSKI